MRDKRLLSLAVVAVAVGLLAAAPALADIAVATLIVDPNDEGGTWETRIRLWSDLGPGTAPSGLGFLDFVLVNVSGAATSENMSPMGTVVPDGGGDPLNVGFWTFRREGGETGGAGAGIMAVQDVDYGDSNDPLLDQLVLTGVGVADSTGWTPPAGHTIGDAVEDWEADTLVAQGEYVGDPDALALQVEGNLSFSVLEDSGDGTWQGPVGDLRPLVSATITQVVKGAGNDGGVGYDRETKTTLVEGEWRIAANTGNPCEAVGDPAEAYVDLNIGAASALTPPRAMDALVVLDSNQDMAGLTVNYGLPGLQGLDLNSPNRHKIANTLRIYTDANLIDLEAELHTAIIDGNALNNGDGIFDSGEDDHPNLGSPSDGVMVGITDQAEDLNGVQHIKIRLTIPGDLDCDGDSDLDDLLAFQRGIFDVGQWDDGDMTGPDGKRDGIVSLDDLLMFQRNLFGTYTPEPATMCLLALGGIVMLRRRRQ